MWSGLFSLSLSLTATPPHPHVPPPSFNERSYCLWPGLKNPRSTFPLSSLKLCLFRWKVIWLRTYSNSCMLTLLHTNVNTHKLEHNRRIPPAHTCSRTYPYGHMNTHDARVRRLLVCTEISDSRPSYPLVTQQSPTSSYLLCPPISSQSYRLRSLTALCVEACQNIDRVACPWSVLCPWMGPVNMEHIPNLDELWGVLRS